MYDISKLTEVSDYYQKKSEAGYDAIVLNALYVFKELGYVSDYREVFGDSYYQKVIIDDIYRPNSKGCHLLTWPATVESEHYLFITLLNAGLIYADAGQSRNYKATSELIYAISNVKTWLLNAKPYYGSDSPLNRVEIHLPISVELKSYLGINDLILELLELVHSFK